MFVCCCFVRSLLLFRIVISFVLFLDVDIVFCCRCCFMLSLFRVVVVVSGFCNDSPAYLCRLALPLFGFLLPRDRLVLPLIRCSQLLFGLVSTRHRDSVGFHCLLDPRSSVIQPIRSHELTLGRSGGGREWEEEEKRVC